MQPIVVLSVAGALLGVLAILLRKSSAARLQVRTGVAVAAVAGTVALAWALVVALAPRRKAASPATLPNPLLMQQAAGLPAAGDFSPGPLAVGDRAPPFQAEGWLNGAPPSPGDTGARLIVADLWAHW